MAGWYDFRVDVIPALGGPPMGVEFGLVICQEEGEEEPQTVFRFVMDRKQTEDVAKKLMDAAAKLPEEPDDEDDEWDKDQEEE